MKVEAPHGQARLVLSLPPSPGPPTPDVSKADSGQHAGVFLFFSFFNLSILYILVYICQFQSPNSSHHRPTPACCFVLYVCVSTSALRIGSSVPFF